MKVTRQPTSVLANLRAFSKLAGRTETRVGWRNNSAYPDDRSAADVAYVAAIMELGYTEGNIPARPMLAPTYEANHEKWRRLMVNNAAAVIDGKLRVQQAFAQLGLIAQGDIQETIRNIHEPALAESTIEARARRRHTTPEAVPSKPLEDSGLLISTVSHEVIQR